jgi:AraC-like DNA-binding protein
VPATTLSVLGDPDDLRAALCAHADVQILVTGRGRFRARVARVVLRRMSLFSGEESLARVAFYSLAPDVVRIILPATSGTPIVLSGVVIRPGELVVHSGQLTWHERTEGPCGWSTIWLSVRDVADYGRATTGRPLLMPPGEYRVRPDLTALRSLTNLLNAAMRAARTHANLPVVAEAARGLEQEVGAALMECLLGAPLGHALVSRRHSDVVLTAFEELLQLHGAAGLSVAQTCASLGVSKTTLRLYCWRSLGLPPSRYIYLWRMHAAHRAIGSTDPGTITAIARRHGFTSTSRFAANYRALFGEPPSATRAHRPV